MAVIRAARAVLDGAALAIFGGGDGSALGFQLPRETEVLPGRCHGKLVGTAGQESESGLILMTRLKPVRPRVE